MEIQWEFKLSSEEDDALVTSYDLQRMDDGVNSFATWP
jgi:hypothetical protein